MGVFAGVEVQGSSSALSAFFVGVVIVGEAHSCRFLQGSQSNRSLAGVSMEKDNSSLVDFVRVV